MANLIMKKSGKFFKKQVLEFRPKLIIVGSTSYPRHFDYKKLREIADSVKAVLVGDIAQISGLVAHGYAPDVFNYCHIVTSTSHKNLRGPKGGFIFALQNHNETNLFAAVNEASFPGFQGGPHNHTIAGLAVALKEAQSDEFKQYVADSIKSAKILAEFFQKCGFKVVTNGTDCHIVLLDFKNEKILRYTFDNLLEIFGITIGGCNFSFSRPNVKATGLRIGTSTMTTRGAQENDFLTIGKFIKEVYDIGVQLQEQTGPSELLNVAKEKIKNDDKWRNLHKSIKEFSLKFKVETMKVK